MGEIAEMMLDGTLCAGCGVALNSEAAGYPVYCAHCRRDVEDDSPAITGKPKKRQHDKVTCPDCGKRVTDVGLQAHIRDKHGVSASRANELLKTMRFILAEACDGGEKPVRSLDRIEAAARDAIAKAEAQP